MVIRPPAPGEGERLREIAIAAKASWGYELEQVKAWAALGDFSPAGLRQREVYVADVDGTPTGWAAAFARGEVWWLDDLWVEPDWMGRGIGSALFRCAADHGLRRGAARMEWEAERNALGFYEKLGGRYLRESEPGVWGRRSPVMGLDLTTCGS